MNKKYIVGLIILLAVLIAFGFSFFQKNKPAMNFNFAVPANNADKATNANNQKKTTKVYQNSNLGFQVTVPKNWEVKESANNVSFFSAETIAKTKANDCSKEGIKQNKCFPDGYGYDLNITTDNSISKADAISGSVKKVLFGNNSFTSFLYPGMSGDQQYFEISNNDKNYLIFSNSEIKESILASWKFIK